MFNYSSIGYLPIYKQYFAALLIFGVFLYPIFGFDNAAMSSLETIPQIETEQIATINYENENPKYRARLFGSMYSYAYYFLDLLVGTPPQRTSVILDTGSSILAFPCSGCDECGIHLDPVIDPVRSNSSEWIDCKDTSRCFGSCVGTPHLKGIKRDPNRCMYTQRYHEGSTISGTYLSDLISIGDTDQHSPPFRYDFIGCHMQETDLFITQKASGIFGLSFPKGYRQPTLIDSIFKKRDIVPDQVFSICISEDGGLFTLGGYEPSLSMEIQPENNNENAIQWTSITSHSSYRVRLTGLSVNEEYFGSGERDFGNTLVDSGTTYSYFPPSVFRKWRSFISQYCTPQFFCQRESDGRPCWRITNTSMVNKLFPTIKAEFSDGAEILWPPESYLYRRTGGFWCDGLDNNEVQSSVLGLSFFKQKQMIFDRGNEKIGMINAVCPNFFIEERPKGPDDIQNFDFSKPPKSTLIPESLPPPLEFSTQRWPPHLVRRPKRYDEEEPTTDAITVGFWIIIGATCLCVVLFIILRCLQCRRLDQDKTNNMFTDMSDIVGKRSYNIHTIGDELETEADGSSDGCEIEMTVPEVEDLEVSTQQFRSILQPHNYTPIQEDTF